MEKSYYLEFFLLDTRLLRIFVYSFSLRHELDYHWEKKKSGFRLFWPSEALMVSECVYCSFLKKFFIL